MRSLALVLVIAGALGMAPAARADVTFDEAFGVGVRTWANEFETCTMATGCRPGFSASEGIAFDAQGRILVAGGSTISRYALATDGTVTFDRAFGASATGAAGGMAGAQAVAVDAHGRILVADAANNRIDRFTVAGDGTVSFDRAFGVGVDTGAAVFENCTTASGCQAGARSNAAGGMASPFGITIDRQDRILVADYENHRIDVFASDSGGTVRFLRAFGLGVDTGVPSPENCTTASGCQDGFPSDDAGGMFFPRGIAVDAKGRILVADLNNARIDRFTVARDGTVSFDLAFGVGVRTGTAVFEHCTEATLCRAGLFTEQAGDMNLPAGLTIDGQGNILVAELASNRISRFAVAGNGYRFDRAFGYGVGGTPTAHNCTTATGCRRGSHNERAGAMSDPGGVAVDPRGRIYVADSANARIDRFFAGPTVTVRTVVTDRGAFDLRVDAAVVRAAAANGQSGSLQVADGASVTISERGRLSDYDTTIDCGSGPRPGPSLTITVTANVTCTITNTRRQVTLPPSVDTIPPTLTAVSLSRRVFAAKRGTVLRYTLSEAARVVVTVKRRGAVGRFVQSSVAGANRHRCSRRIGHLALKPGKYRVTLVATDAAGNRSAARRLRFRVVKR